MKIALNFGQDGQQSSKAAADHVLERDIQAARKGDWDAKHNLVRTFTPLLTSLAEKRSHDLARINRYMEAGKQGLYTAARKCKSNTGADKFRIFALDHIEAAMNSVDKGAGFWSRLFRRQP